MSGQWLFKVQTEFSRQEEVNLFKNLCFIAATWLELEISDLEGEASNSTGKNPKNLIFEVERIEKK